MPNVKYLTVLFFSFIVFTINAQQVYEIEASHIEPKVLVEINMQATNPQGIKLSVNNQYFEKDGKPWFPLMGEMHYNRVPPQDWEEGILKMKSAGLSVIATYVFWNEHETSPGIWDWKGNRDLKHFIELCAKHNMYVWLRIGPWSHGEQKNGGFPNWIASMKGTRSNAPAYIDSATLLFNEIGRQTKDLFFKDGGPVIGTQLENEYASGQAEHISKLKKLALNAHINPVFWSVTANTVFDDKKMEVIPLQGSYCYRGWEKAGGGPTKDFLYGDDQWIMTDALGKVFYDVNRFPRGLCEQGGGSQMTYENRFVVKPEVMEAHLQNQVGRGMNLIGYYMFHGGTQTPGLKEPGYPESYNFQAPVGEFGIIRQSYKNLKILHQFINSFGSELAQMQPAEPAHAVRNIYDTTTLRYIARIKDNSGFLFLCNTQVRIPMPDKQVAMGVKLKDETINFPAIILKGQTTLILPFNLKINNVTIKYVTAQPLTKIEDGNTATLFMIKPEAVNPSISIEVGKDSLVTSALKLNEPFIVNSQNGKKLIIILLSRKDAENSWSETISGKQLLFITNADVIVDNDHLQLQQVDEPVFHIKVYPKNTLHLPGMHKIRSTKDAELYDDYNISLKPVSLNIKPQIENKHAEVHLPIVLPKNLNDIFIKIIYLGGSCTLTQHNKLLTDNLFNATPWLVSTKNYLNTNSLQFKIDDWNDNITGIDEKLVQEIKATGSRFENIEILPQYKVNLDF